MELRVESADLPAGSYVGIRIGDVLKQGRYEPQRRYNFPRVDRRRTAKIDIYRHVATCSVAVDPDVLSKHEVDVTSMDPSFTAAKIQVHVESKKEEINKPAQDNKTKALKNQAKDYLVKHGIEERLSEAVKALLKEQPSAPTDFLVRHLTGSQPPAPGTSPDKSNVQADTKPAKPEALVPEKSGAPRADLAALRQQAAQVLIQASADGSLTQVLKEVKLEEQAPKQQKVADKGDLTEGKPQQTDKKKEHSDALKARAAGILTEAANNGELEKALQELEQDSNRSAKETAMAPGRQSNSTLMIFVMSSAVKAPCSVP